MDILFDKTNFILFHLKSIYNRETSIYDTCHLSVELFLNTRFQLCLPLLTNTGLKKSFRVFREYPTS